LGNDIISLMTSVRPYVKKKATLCTYPLFLNYPEALRPAFPRLKVCVLVGWGGGSRKAPQQIAGAYRG
jgi:hypothetical protein